MNPLRPFGVFLPAFVRRRMSRARARLESVFDTANRTRHAETVGRSEQTDNRSANIPKPDSRQPSAADTTKKSQVRKRTRKPASQAKQDDGTTFTGSGLARYLGVSDTTITNMRRERKVYGYNVNRRAVAYPKAQIIQGASKRPARVIPGVDKVLAHFHDTDAAWQWLNTEQAEVGTKTRQMTTPLSELRRGRLKAVMAQLPTQQAALL